MADRASSAAGVCPSIPNMGASCPPLNPRQHRKVLALRARLARLTAELEARADDAVADFLHAEHVRVEFRLLKVAGWEA